MFGERIHETVMYPSFFLSPTNINSKPFTGSKILTFYDSEGRRI
jgi:hypothetical protein